jgi:hypothetical protein
MIALLSIGQSHPDAPARVGSLLGSVFYATVPRLGPKPHPALAVKTGLLLCRIPKRQSESRDSQCRVICRHHCPCAHMATRTLPTNRTCKVLCPESSLRRATIRHADTQAPISKQRSIVHLVSLFPSARLDSTRLCLSSRPGDAAISHLSICPDAASPCHS